MTGKVSDTVQCSSCRQYFNRILMPASGDHKCPECMKKYKREWNKRTRQRRKLKESEEYRHCENFGSAGLYC
jgi:uncharacterized paraquat-inducible protein A